VYRYVKAMGTGTIGSDHRVARHAL
jgi:hypothetical protein